MIIQPRFRGFICTTAHPIGCATWIDQQVKRLEAMPALPVPPSKVLIIGASTGYGLATRLVTTFAGRADSIGVWLEKPGRPTRTATAGWYQTAALERRARALGRKASSVCGDAFATQTKEQTLRRVAEELGPVDLVVYSLAAPRRLHPSTGKLASSVLKPIGQPYHSKTLDFHSGEVSEVTLPPATPEEIADTVAVMGGEDLQLWVEALLAERLLAPQARVVTYSYVGSELTQPIYRGGTVGRAKDHLEATVRSLDERLQKELPGARALIAINKAVVTQSSAAIPVVPLYVSVLRRVMEEAGVGEDSLQQIHRLFSEHLYEAKLPLDAEGRLRIDDRELQPAIQAEVKRRFAEVNTDRLAALADVQGYRDAFFRLFGFQIAGVDYTVAVDPEVPIPDLVGEQSK